MAKVKFDGVVEAVRYRSNGEIEWVRAYERRGSIFSDYLLLNRGTLLERMRGGKRYMTGKRIPYYAGMFETALPLRVVKDGGKEIILSGETNASHDRLEGVPLV